MLEPQSLGEDGGLVSTALLFPHLLERDDVRTRRDERGGDAREARFPRAAAAPEVPRDHAEPGVDERAELQMNVGVNLLVLGGHVASNGRTCRLDAGVSTRAAHSTVTLLARLRG